VPTEVPRRRVLRSGVMANEERRWTGRAALGVGLAALGAVLLGFVLDERLFGSDPSNDRAYLFARGVALLAAFAVAFGIHGWARGSPQVRTPAIAGLGVGLLALLGTALFVFGTMLIGG
jgi:hypothetical protein